MLFADWFGRMNWHLKTGGDTWPIDRTGQRAINSKGADPD